MNIQIRVIYKKVYLLNIGVDYSLVCHREVVSKDNNFLAKYINKIIYNDKLLIASIIVLYPFQGGYNKHMAYAAGIIMLIYFPIKPKQNEF